MISVVLALFGAHTVAELLCDLQKGPDWKSVYANELHESELLSAQSWDAEHDGAYSSHESAIRSVGGKCKNRLGTTAVVVLATTTKITTKQQV